MVRASLNAKSSSTASNFTRFPAIAGYCIRPIQLVSVIVLLLTGAILIIFGSCNIDMTNLGVTYMAGTADTLTTGAVVLLTASILIHWIGVQIRWRDIKYELAISAFGLLLMSETLQRSMEPLALSYFRSAAVPIYELAPSSFVHSVQWQIAAVILVIPFSVLVLRSAIRLGIAKISSREDGYLKMIRLHGWSVLLRKVAVFAQLVVWPTIVISRFRPDMFQSRVPIPSIGVIVAHLLLSLYIVVRFEFKRFFWSKPILYLRSFSHNEALLGFSRIVAPVAGRYGALIGLVHDVQPGHVLQRSVSALDRGAFVEASNSEWRSWVKRALSACCFAVIDISNLTVSVEWELSAALEVLGSQHTLIIEYREHPERLISQPCHIYYSSDLIHRRAARRALEQWFSTAARATRSALPGEFAAPVALRSVVLDVADTVRQSTTVTALAGLIGNALEWFDFALYGFFAGEIGKQFFPASDATAQKLLALIGFSARFVARPFGSVNGHQDP